MRSVRMMLLKLLFEEQMRLKFKNRGLGWRKQGCENNVIIRFKKLNKKRREKLHCAESCTIKKTLKFGVRV
jgi:hypothetical protein